MHQVGNYPELRRDAGQQNIKFRLKVLFGTVIFAIRKDSEGSQASPSCFILLVSVVLGLRWVWSSGRMILKRENRNMWRKTYPTATLSATNLSHTSLGSNVGIHSDRPAAIHMSLVTSSNNIQKLSSSELQGQLANVFLGEPVALFGENHKKSHIHKF